MFHELYNIEVAVTFDVVGQADVTAISGYTTLNPSKDPGAREQEDSV